MKVYGQLEKSQLENVTSDPAGVPNGMIVYRTDLKQVKVANGTIFKFLIDEDTTQTLSNKTYASPITTGATQYNEIATPTTPGAGLHKLYFKADGKAYTLDSAGNEAQVGSGAGGGSTNLITNGNADDTAATIFVPYADAAASRPVDGTGGSPTVTTSVSSTSPLIGTKSFLLTKPASNVQGQGWSIPFTVDQAYRAKSLKISVDFIINSGTFTAGTSTTDSDVIWYIYDVTNSQLIEPSNIKMLSNSSTLSDKFQASFQTSVSGSSYRLIAHVASTSASAYELKVDQVTVSPQTYVYGTPTTDFVQYTPTLLGFGTPTNVKFLYRRNGDTIDIVGEFQAGTPTAVTAVLPLPPGLTLDTNKGLPTLGGYYGTWIRNTATGSTRKRGKLQTNTAIGTSLVFANDDYTTAVGAGAALNGSDVAAASNIISVHVTALPIQGWSSSVQMSDNADTRVVAMTVTPQVPGGIITSGGYNPTIFTSVLQDTHAAYNTTTGKYTVKSAGYFKMSAVVDVSAGFTIDQFVGVRVTNETSGAVHYGYQRAYKTGTFDMCPSVSGIVYANVGDLLSCGVISQGTSPAYSSNLALSSLSIEKVQGPQEIAASETITARASSTAGQTFATGTATTISYATITRDSHGSWTGTQYRAPSPGLYRCKFHLETDHTAVTATNFMQLYKNVSTFVSEVEYAASYGAFNQNWVIDDLVYLLAGETIECKFFNGSGTTRTANTSAGRNFVNIVKVGN